MTAQRVRSITICIFRRDDHILVFEGYDPTKEQTFYRPLGGGIEFGETSADALTREMREEIGADVTDLRYIGTLENIFTYDGATGHEIVQVYEGRFMDDSFYDQASVQGVEDNGALFRALWKHIDSFSLQRPLYPDGLLELLHQNDQIATNEA